MRARFSAFYFLLIWVVSFHAHCDLVSSSVMSFDFVTQYEKLKTETEQLKTELLLLKQNSQTILDQKNEITAKIDHIQQVLATLDEQGKWLSFSTDLGNSLREQLLALPKKYINQPVEATIAEIKVKQFHYNSYLVSLKDQEKELATLDLAQHEKDEYLLLLRINIQLIEQIIHQYDSMILDLTRLKIESEQLNQSIQEVNDATHRYFFWVANVPTMNLHFIQLFISDLSLFLSLQTTEQLFSAVYFMLQTPSFILFLATSCLLVFIQFKLRHRFSLFLTETALKIGKVTQDNYFLTLKTIFYSLLMAAPFPSLWGCLGYGLQLNWNVPIANAIGYGVNCAAPILWFFMISRRFASSKGLFISHLGWDEKRVNLAMRYYNTSIWGLIPLIILVTSLEQYNNQQFAATIGRVSFIILCLFLVFLTNTIHRAHVPLYIDKHGSGDNFLGHSLWFIMLIAPWFAIIAAIVGYLSTAEALLARLEASVGIWLTLLLIYFLIRRWMWIQKRRIEFERAKQKRLERLAQRTKIDDDIDQGFNNIEIEEPIIDLDEISSQSLHLVRSIILMIALIIMILLWSELHSAFSFMQNIKLWVTTTSINGVDAEEYITLSSVCIAILTLLITIQLVKNLPALFELAILQHLELTPGSGYAIITLTKYVLILIGCITIFYFLGIDWSKIQWLIAALGVGLGFGLQEIFANFISGLIVLFEKPIRIGDTVTIRDLTGTITKINTRATTIVDWDRKEIVMPNKAFITEQLVNWSLSDGVTRITLSIPATIDADSELICDILLKVAKENEYVLEEPKSEVFLVDIQEGIQIFEMRIFVAELKYRMKVRDLIHKMIIQEYKIHHLTLPFPPLQTNLSTMGFQKTGRRAFSAGGV